MELQATPSSGLRPALASLNISNDVLAIEAEFAGAMSNREKAMLRGLGALLGKIKLAGQKEFRCILGRYMALQDKCIGRYGASRTLSISDYAQVAGQISMPGRQRNES